MIIRHARQTDASQLKELLQQLGYCMSIEGMQKRIQLFAEQDDQIMVAEKEGQLVGVIAFGFYELFRLEGKTCHIDSLIVDQGSRGIGVGKQLIAYVEAYAKKRGVVILELISSNNRIKDGTHAFYKGLGFKDHGETNYTYFTKTDFD